MKKNISLLVVLSLATFIFAQTAVSADNKEEKKDDTALFLSLTKKAESLSDLTTNLTVITDKEIKEKSAKTLGDIVQGELGISYKNYGSLGQAQAVSMRGAKSNQTLVLIDGRKVNSITNGTSDFTAIPVNMIERVEIIRGSGAAIYGTGAFGGVINVITKKATPLMPNINPYFSYGTFNTINAGITGAYANENISVLITPSLLSSDGYRQNSFYNSKNIFGKIGINVTENSEIILSGQAYNADIANPGQTGAPYPVKDKQFEDNNYLKLDYNTEIKDFKIQVSGYNANNTSKVYDFMPANFNTANTGAKGAVSYKGMITLGLEWDKTEFKKKDFDTKIESINKNRETSAAYLQSIFNIGNLTLIPVVRGDLNSDTENVFTPALSAVYKLADKIKLSGNASKVFRAPTFNELYWPNWGNPDLKPEQGWSYDLGFEYSQGKFTGMITGFYIDSKNLIPTSWVGNIDKAKQYGYEVGLKYNMYKEVKHKLNYTYTRSEDMKNKTDIPYIPMHNLNYAITVKPVKPLKITADISYVARIYVNDINYNTGEYRDYLADYCLVNVRADYQINKYVSLWAKGNNLTNNDKYQLSYGYPMPGITGTAGIDLKF
jgi:outer membrane cobalamin receptor